MTAAARAHANEIARISYGKLLAIIAAKTGDMAAAEDFLAFAFERALRSWVNDGIPPNPEGWLITTARNKFLDDVKSAANRYLSYGEDAMKLLAFTDEFETDRINDKRLALMFVCAHPAIDAQIRTPLILQTILGLDATFISTVFAVPATTMAQRLVRAKKKIKLTRIPFDTPALVDMYERLGAVLEAIYGAYAIGINQNQDVRHELADEALYLSDILIRALPDHAETYGLAALLSYSIGCADNGSDYKPLSERNPDSWNEALLDRGDRLLFKAQSLKSLGQFQLEAAIFAVHADRRKTGEVNQTELLKLYDGLLRINPTLGAITARAAIIGDLVGAEEGLRSLDAIATKAKSFQPYWAVKAKLLKQAGETEGSVCAAEKAIVLSTNRRFREYLKRQYCNP